MTGSLQLRQYLRARRNGTPTEVAAAQCGFTKAEARLTDADAAKGLLDHVAHPEAAGCAATATEEIVMQDESETEDLPVAELAADTLRGDVRDAFLSWFKATPKPWSAMGEAEQRQLADSADKASRHLVKDACQLIAASERPCIVATLTEYREKDGVEAKLKLASRGEIVAALHEACGKEVLVVTSGYEEFAGQAGEAQIDADQPELHGIGDEYAEAA